MTVVAAAWSDRVDLLNGLLSQDRVVRVLPKKTAAAGSLHYKQGYDPTAAHVTATAATNFYVDQTRPYSSHHSTQLAFTSIRLVSASGILATLIFSTPS